MTDREWQQSNAVAQSCKGNKLQISVGHADWGTLAMAMNRLMYFDMYPGFKKENSNKDFKCWKK